MGVELKVISAKVERVNDAWLDLLVARINERFPLFRLTKSSLLNGILTRVRTASDAGDLSALPADLQDLPGNPRLPGIPTDLTRRAPLAGSLVANEPMSPEFSLIAGVLLFGAFLYIALFWRKQR